MVISAHNMCTFYTCTKADTISNCTVYMEAKNLCRAQRDVFFNLLAGEVTNNTIYIYYNDYISHRQSC